MAENLTLLLLPAYSPELNTVELLWRQMRDKHLSNQLFETADQLDRDIVKTWCAVTCQPESVRSLCVFPGLNWQSVTKIPITLPNCSPDELSAYVATTATWNDRCHS
jgi:hypothetical protein